MQSPMRQRRMFEGRKFDSSSLLDRLTVSNVFVPSFFLYFYLFLSSILKPLETDSINNSTWKVTAFASSIFPLLYALSVAGIQFVELCFSRLRKRSFCCVSPSLCRTSFVDRPQNVIFRVYFFALKSVASSAPKQSFYCFSRFRHLRNVFLPISFSLSRSSRFQTIFQYFRSLAFLLFNEIDFSALKSLFIHVHLFLVNNCVTGNPKELSHRLFATIFSIFVIVWQLFFGS